MLDAVLFITGLLCAFNYLLSLGQLGRYLKERHELTWRELGMPSNVFYGNSIQTNRFLYRFVLKGEFRKLADPRLDQVCGKVKVTLYAAFGCIFYLQAKFLLIAFKIV